MKDFPYQFKRLLLQVLSASDLRHEVLARSSAAANKFAALVLACETSAAIPAVEVDERAAVREGIHAYLSACKEFASDGVDTRLMSALQELGKGLEVTTKSVRLG